MLTLLVFLLILGCLVFVHEAGHFVAARFAKIKVEEFAFGFPPRLISWKRHETRYALNLLPLGGYVKLLGEDGESQDPRSFGKQPVWVRLAVIVAGVFMNILLTVVVLWLGFMIGMTPLVSDPATLGGQQQPEILVTEVVANSPAAQAGLKAGDILVGFRSTDAFKAAAHDHLGGSFPLTIRRNGTNQAEQLTLGTNPDAPVGVVIYQTTKVKLSFFPALKASLIETGRTIGATVHFLGRFLGQLFTTGHVSDEVSGPVGIYQTTGYAVELGFTYVLQLLAMLSISLALLNILPFPALDGGRALFVLLEGIFRRKVIRDEIEATIHAIGFVLLLLLIVLVTYKDIVRLH